VLDGHGSNVLGGHGARVLGGHDRNVTEDRHVWRVRTECWKATVSKVLDTIRQVLDGHGSNVLGG